MVSQVFYIFSHDEKILPDASAVLNRCSAPFSTMTQGSLTPLFSTVVSGGCGGGLSLSPLFGTMLVDGVGLPLSPLSSIMVLDGFGGGPRLHLLSRRLPLSPLSNAMLVSGFGGGPRLRPLSRRLPLSWLSNAMIVDGFGGGLVCDHCPEGSF